MYYLREDLNFNIGEVTSLIVSTKEIKKWTRVEDIYTDKITKKVSSSKIKITNTENTNRGIDSGSWNRNYGMRLKKPKQQKDRRT